MIRRLHYLLSGLLLCTFLAGCPAVELRDANEQLTSYYLAKQQAIDSKDWRMLETTIASLQSLSEDAAERARNEDNRLNRIALYRIAATAAWQAEDPDVVAYGREGQSLCDDATFNLAPRDCGMLLVIPTLASVDETTGRLNALQTQVVSVDPDISEDMKQRAEEIAEDYIAALDSLLLRRGNIQSSGAHPQFKGGVDDRIAELLCVHLESARGLLVLTGSAQQSDLETALAERGCRFLETGFPREELRCAPAACN